MRQNVALFFFFALVAALCDRVWVSVGAMSYPGYTVQPWWVPLQYGAVGVVAVNFAAWATHYLVYRDTRAPEDPAARFAVSASWFVAAFLACGLFDRDDARYVALALVLIWLVRFLLQRPKRGERMAILLICLGLAAAGVIGEAVLVHFGVMRYTRPAFLGLPLWLPGLYLQAGYLARDIARLWFAGR
jgi:hypothetical protein